MIKMSYVSKRDQADSHLKAPKNHFRYSFKQLHIFKDEALTDHMISVIKSCVNFFYH